MFKTIHEADLDSFPLGALAEEIFSGSTPLSKGDAYVEPPAGVRFIRSGEITHDGKVERISENHIREEIHNGPLSRSRLRNGDLLIAIVGATIGEVGVYRSREEANINQAIAAVRIRTAKAIPEYICSYIQSPIGQQLLDFFKRPVARANINLEEISQIPILLPTLKIQEKLVAAMDEARGQRQVKLTEADTLLTGLDAFVANSLGLTLPSKDSRKVFAVRRADVQGQGRLNSDYFHPERILAIRAMKTEAQRLMCQRLDEVVYFIRDQIETPGPNYLSLAHVQSHTGELVAADEEAAGSCSKFEKDDVLFARLRPYLNKVHHAEMAGCCSPEFHVLRPKDAKSLRPEYLAAILRSSLILAQTRHMMTGNTHPRLTNEDVVNLVIPVPKPAVQELITAEVHHRRDKARRLRTEAEAVWQDAKRWFEEQLLGKNASEQEA